MGKVHQFQCVTFIVKYFGRVMGSLCRILLLFGVICIPSVFGIGSVEKDIWNYINGGGSEGKFIPGNNTKIDVSLGFELIKLSDYDEGIGGVQILFWLKNTYTIPGVSWDPEKFNKINKIAVPPKMLWTPDFVPYQQAGPAENFGARPVIMNNGLTMYIPSFRLAVTCVPELDGPAYPRDRKRCTIKVGSWVYSGDLVNLTMAELSKEEYFKPVLGNWKFIKLEQKFKNMYYPCCTEAYPSIKYEIVIERVRSYFALTTAVPGLVTGLVIVLLFFLPVSSPARIISQTICLMILVIISVFNLSKFMKADRMVPVARYLMAAMVLDLFAILWSVIASVLWIQTQDKGTETGCVASLLSKLECICCLPTSTGRSSKDGEEPKSDQSGKQNRFSAVQRFTLVLDRIFGLLFLLIFILLFCCMRA